MIGVTSPGHTSRVCSECKKPLQSGAAVTCSAKCRKRRERRQKDQHAAWVMALHHLSQIRDALKRGEDIAHHQACLIRLKDEIYDLLVLAGDKDMLARLDMLNARRRN